VGLVLTYYRRHPQRARTRLAGPAGRSAHALPAPAAERLGAARRTPAGAPLSSAAEDAHALWLRTQSGVAPLKRKK
jgi:hypothetical protein